jgi:hypothetical protein
MYFGQGDVMFGEDTSGNTRDQHPTHEGIQIIGRKMGAGKRKAERKTGYYG